MPLGRKMGYAIKKPKSKVKKSITSMGSKEQATTMGRPARRMTIGRNIKKLGGFRSYRKQLKQIMRKRRMSK